jgi:hypothetical protein
MIGIFIYNRIYIYNNGYNNGFIIQQYQRALFAFRTKKQK